MPLGGVPQYTLVDGLKIALARERIMRKIKVTNIPSFQIVTFDDVSIYWPAGDDYMRVIEFYCETMFPFHPHCYNTGHTMLTPSDVVLDCGACEGIFGKQASAIAEKVYLFEPFEPLYACLEKTFETEIKSQKVEIVISALGEYNGTVGFEEREGTVATGAGYVTESSGARKVPICTIDSFVTRNNIEKIDYIKSDVEGAEARLIRGAKDTISRHKPKLAISTYHQYDDAETIKECVLDIRKDYQYEFSGEVLFPEGRVPVMAHFW